MPQPVDVGSVLGGRYKVTGHVLASADGDLVLDGVDQVLNRPVSILLASRANASQMTTSARELATGERAGNMQVLDLGISDEHTYLITNKAQPADLLDLVIEQQPYIEPFFTDTLGSEIFGQPRSTEPVEYEDDDDYYHEQERKQRFSRKPRPAQKPLQQEPEPVTEEHTAHQAPQPAATPPAPKAPPRVLSADDDAPQERRESRFPAAAAGVASGAVCRYCWCCFG